MRIFLIGVSCVGVTAVGALLAERLGCAFYDMPFEIEKHFGKPLTHLRRLVFRESLFRSRYAVPVLKKLILADPGCDVVIGLSPAGLQDVVWDVVKQVDRVVVELRDSAENILKRITFYDDDSKRIEKTLTEYEQQAYFEEIAKDIAYYRRSYNKANFAVDMHGLDAAQSAEKVELALRDWVAAQE
jgi:shikimate kinase